MVYRFSKMLEMKTRNHVKSFKIPSSYLSFVITLASDCLGPSLKFPNTMRVLYQLFGMAHMGF